MTSRWQIKQGLILDTEETEFSRMLEDRNTSTHTYDEQEANEIFLRVRDAHLPAIQALLTRLKSA